MSTSSSYPSFHSEEFWRRTRVDGGCCCWATLAALGFILVWHLFFSKKSFILNKSNAFSGADPVFVPRLVDSRSGISNIVTDEDLKGLIEKLDENIQSNEIWENVIDRRNNHIAYKAKCCKPEDGGALKYLSVTVFEDCSPELLRDFYMDNDYRKQWDKTVVEHDQLQVDTTTGIEIGRTIKKFPLLTPREYILGWKLWEGKDNSFYCFIKECEHHLAPRQRKYVRVDCFRSGWRIRKVPGRNACEIKMFHQEDAGLNVDMAKLVFSKGIWSYVCKMDTALRKYALASHQRHGQAASAVTLIRKVPSDLDIATEGSSPPETISVNALHTLEAKRKKLLRKPSKKLLANGLILLGGAVCLSRGHSALGAKVAMAYFLSKMSKRGAATSQSNESQGT